MHIFLVIKKNSYNFKIQQVIHLNVRKDFPVNNSSYFIRDKMKSSDSVWSKYLNKERMKEMQVLTLCLFQTCKGLLNWGRKY